MIPWTGYLRKGFVTGLLVLVGAELNRESHHYLALNLEQLAAGNEINPQEMVDRVRQSGALGFYGSSF